MTAGLELQVAEQARLFVQLLAQLRTEDNRLFDRRPDVAALAEELFSGFGDIAVACSENGPEQADVPEVPDPDARRRMYRELVERIRDRVAALLPAGSTVAVVSRGDAALLQLPGLVGWHFPQNELGVWAGYHPETGEEAVELAARIHAKGARFLLIPATAFWWLDFYEPLREYVRSACRSVAEDGDFALFEFPAVSPPPSTTPTTIGSRRYHLQGAQFTNFVRALMPTDSVVLVVTRGDDGLLAPGVRARHFPSDSHGVYLGTPADDLDVLGALERAIAGGAEYLAVPRSMDWWIEMYPALRQRIRAVYPCIADRRETGSIYQLTAPSHQETT